MYLRSLYTALALGSILFVAPLAAQAIMYAPGATLNPACGPTDPTCGVTTPFTLFQNGNVGIGTLVPTAPLDITGTNTTAVIGPEMITVTADRDFSSDTGNWTGTGWTIGSGVITHIAGATSLTLDNTALSSIPVNGNVYQITFTANTTGVGLLTPIIGGVTGIPIGQQTGVITQVVVLFSFGGTPVIFTPNATWTGTIDNVSVKLVTPFSATQIIRNSNGTVSTELRAGGTGFRNSFIGTGAGQSNTTGNFDTANGWRALIFNTTGGNNTALGTSALQANSTGGSNTAVGASALASNTIGLSNTAIGVGALGSNSIGSGNTASGQNALNANSSGINNTANGTSALLNNGTGSGNTASGYSALLNNTTGSNNTAMGFQAIDFNTTGSSNTANGFNALLSNTTGTSNVANGWGTLNFNASATSSVAVGLQAGAGTVLYSNQGGVYVGYRAGLNATTGSDFNTLLGYQSGSGVTTGARNVLIGVSGIAASTGQITTGSSNISIGNDVAVASSTLSNQLDIGNLIYGTGLSGTGLTISTGSIGIGTTTPGAKLDVNGTIRQTGCLNGALSSNASGDIICTSDLAFKQNVTPFTSGLSAIEGINPSYFQYKGESFTHAGFIAQNVQTVLPDAVSQQANGSLGLDTNAILAAAVNAIKELDTRINGGVPTAIATAQSSLQSLANNIGETASALTSDAFTQIASWLGDAGNGIGDFFANRVRTKELCVSDTIGETCVTRAQLDAVLAGIPLPPTPPTPPVTPPTPESVATTTPLIPPEATSTPLLPNTGSVASFNRTLDIGSSGSDVVALQNILMQKGFMYLPPMMVLGYFGELTRSAVMMYQTSIGLPPVGIVGPLTIAKLNAELGRQTVR